MITVYVGDIGDYLSILCRSIDLSATLVTQENFSNLAEGVYYTSIADSGSLLNFSSVLRQATKIIYVPPIQWSDYYKGHSKMQEWTEEYLNIFSFICDVENFSPQAQSLHKDTILSLADQRHSEKQQLWIAGCSISHGVGVTTQTKYGHLLSNKLNMPASFLTCGGSSIVWAADQILRSDIRDRDIVVWGLTSWSRTPFFKNNVLTHVHPFLLETHSKALYPITPDTLTSDHLFYQSLTSVFQVINFCQKVNATLVIADLVDERIYNYLGDLPNFIMLSRLWGRGNEDRFIDVGSDNIHPGPKTHKFYAEQIYQKLQQILA